jgi:hypothetical protein
LAGLAVFPSISPSHSSRLVCATTSNKYTRLNTRLDWFGWTW